MNTKRKLVFALILIITVTALLSIFIFRRETRGKPFGSLIMDEKKVEEILSSRTETDKRIESLIMFDGMELPYDSSSRTYYYSVAENSKAAYSPSVYVRGSEGKVRLMFTNGGITDEKISSGEYLNAVVYSDREYRKIKIACTSLPVISISCEGEIGKDYTNMKVRLFDNRKEATSRLTTCDGKIHTRGNTSLHFGKKSYRITLRDMSLGNNNRELDISLLGMRKDGDWILYAAYNDQERIRNVFCSNLWNYSCGKNNSFGIDNGIEYKYVELIIDNEYCGLYALGYPLDNKQLGITNGEYTFQKYTWKKELSLDFSDYSVLEDNFTVQLGNVDADSKVIWGGLSEYYRALQNMSRADDRIKGLCDIDNAVDVFLFLNFVQGVDNVDRWATLNLDQTVKLRGRNPVMIYTPWDLDQTFGNIWDQKRDNWISPYGFDSHTDRVMKVNPAYMLMMYGDEEVLTRVKNRYRELRSGPWSEEQLGRAIDGYEKQIFGSGAYKRDTEKWPDSTKLEDQSLKLTLFRNYVMDRLKYMDKYVENLSADGLMEKYEVYGK